MKLYVAAEIIPYEGGYVLGVYSTRELAEKRIDTYGRDQHIGYEVFEIELDQDTEISI